MAMRFKTITKRNWQTTPKDYKGIVKGVRYKLFLDKKTGGTVYSPVKVKGMKNPMKR